MVRSNMDQEYIRLLEWALLNASINIEKICVTSRIEKDPWDDDYDVELEPESEKTFEYLGTISNINTERIFGEEQINYIQVRSDSLIKLLIGLEGKWNQLQEAIELHREFKIKGKELLKDIVV